MLSKVQEKQNTIDYIETYNLDETYKELKEKYKTNYRILEERKRTEYKFPFSFRYKYQIKVEEIIEKTDKTLQSIGEKEIEKQSILKSLREEKYVEKRFTIFESEEAVRKFLIDQEIEQRIIDKWFDEIKKESKKSLNEDELIVKIKEKINHTISSKESEMLNGVCLFFGVTGIGKTTTIVKIAKKLENNKKVGIITTDNYKMGAYHQMEQKAKKMKAGKVWTNFGIGLGTLIIFSLAVSSGGQ